MLVLLGAMHAVGQALSGERARQEWKAVAHARRVTGTEKACPSP